MSTFKEKKNFFYESDFLCRNHKKKQLNIGVQSLFSPEVISIEHALGIEGGGGEGKQTQTTNKHNGGCKPPMKVKGQSKSYLA